MRAGGQETECEDSFLDASFESKPKRPLQMKHSNKENFVQAKKVTHSLPIEDSKIDSQLYFKLLREEKEKIRVRFEKDQRRNEQQITDLLQAKSNLEGEINLRTQGVAQLKNELELARSKIAQQGAQIKSVKSSLKAETMEASQLMQEEISKLKEELQLSSRKALQSEAKLQQSEQKHKQILKEQQIQFQFHCQHLEGKIAVKDKQQQAVESSLKRRDQESKELIETLQRENLQLKINIFEKDEQIEEMATQLDEVKEQIVEEVEAHEKIMLEAQQQVEQFRNQLRRQKEEIQKLVDQFLPEKNGGGRLQEFRNFICGLVNQTKLTQRDFLRIEQQREYFEVKEKELVSKLSDLKEENDFLREQIKRNEQFHVTLRGIKNSSVSVGKQGPKVELKPQFILKKTPKNIEPPALLQIVPQISEVSPEPIQKQTHPQHITLQKTFQAQRCFNQRTRQPKIIQPDSTVDGRALRYEGVFEQELTLMRNDSFHKMKREFYERKKSLVYIMNKQKQDHQEDRAAIRRGKSLPVIAPSRPSSSLKDAILQKCKGVLG